MRPLSAGITVTIVALSLTADAKREYDPAFTMKAYRLSAEQEQSFSGSDSKPSGFWAIWDVEGADLDEVTLTGENCAWGACSPVPDEDDVTYTIRLAWGEKGVYILHTVSDDTWADLYPPCMNYDNDVVELYTDGHSARELYENQVQLYIHSDYEITKSFTGIQIMLGGDSPAEDFLLTTPEPGITVGGSYEGQAEFLDHEAKVIAESNEVMFKFLYYGETPDVRGQEWLVPWGTWGGDGVGMPSEGDKLAVTFGYDDLDGIGQGVQPHVLRWRNRADPFSIGSSVGSWGDVEFAGTLLQPEASVDTEPQERGTGPSPVRNLNDPAAAHAGAHYYTPQGRRVRGTKLSHLPAGAVLIRRSAGARKTQNGESRGSKLRIIQPF